MRGPTPADRGGILTTIFFVFYSRYPTLYPARLCHPEMMMPVDVIPVHAKTFEYLSVRVAFNALNAS